MEFTASHLHEHIFASESYPSNLERAIKDGFKKTNDNFCDVPISRRLTFNKRKRCGTTVVCILIHGKYLYFAWLGDSEAALVRNSQLVKVVDPHKPGNPDEKSRIGTLSCFQVQLQYGEAKLIPFIYLYKMDQFRFPIL